MSIRASILLSAVAALPLLAASPALAHGPRHQVISEETELKPLKGGYANMPTPDKLGGAFELLGPDGATITEKSYPGKWKILFFGYPSCREACPLALERLTQTLEALGPAAERLQPLFVDISMEKPDLLGVNQFVSNFHPSIHGLAGTRAQTFKIVRLFQVRREYGRRSGPTETGPRIDHTTLFYLIDPDGRTRAYFYHGLTPEKMVAAIREHMM